MIIFIVYNAQGRYSRRIGAAAERLGCQVKLLSWKDFEYGVIGELDPGADVIFFRTGALAAVRIARAFEDAGFRVVNDSRYIQLSAQKYLANIHARASGIPIPDLNVRIKKDNHDLLSLLLKQNGPLVVKPVISRDQGRYVYLIGREPDLRQAALVPGSHILVQSEVKFDRLVRTIVVKDGMLVEATEYDIKRDTWKASVCDNPLATHYRQVPSELIRIVEQTLRAFGGDIGYIDYYETSNGFVFNEINHSCDLMHQEQITGCPIANRLGEFLAHIQALTGPSRGKSPAVDP
jgi:glutathione synthase/RimK-type ligase-like ATP-grasp enzyme